MSNNILYLTCCSNLVVDELKLETPVQGTVWKVVTKVGQNVEAGGTVLIVESMKMEIPVDSPSSGIVSELFVSEGDQVEQDSVVAVIDIS
ncbi:MAG: acetyl-CoA carboxylase biotin carboxyl carrier protein subunit [Acidimicrobiaceae bacterium]|nr:acetyl-CoA carboxylase biotin carboxyl carrier protein subunit [Acidimicrobiaceae bacterium]|tara:strand:- start:71 stop:340 length:270 start_codon:yes stop_codon:yes gene_type:complete